jgi:hypothetical protein
MKKKSLFLAAIGLMVIAFSYYSCVKDAGQSGTPVSQSFCDNVNTKFASVQLPMFQSHCAIPGCHDGGGGAPGNFGVYLDVKAVADNGKLGQRVITLKDMPPAGQPPLADSTISKLNCWLNKGAQNN